MHNSKTSKTNSQTTGDEITIFKKEKKKKRLCWKSAKEIKGFKGVSGTDVAGKEFCKEQQPERSGDGSAGLREEKNCRENCSGEIPTSK